MPRLAVNDISLAIRHINIYASSVSGLCFFLLIFVSRSQSPSSSSQRPASHNKFCVRFKYFWQECGSMSFPLHICVLLSACKALDEAGELSLPRSSALRLLLLFNDALANFRYTTVAPQGGEEACICAQFNRATVRDR